MSDTKTENWRGTPTDKWKATMSAMQIAEIEKENEKTTTTNSGKYETSPNVYEHGDEVVTIKVENNEKDKEQKEGNEITD